MKRDARNNEIVSLMDSYRHYRNVVPVDPAYETRELSYYKEHTLESVTDLYIETGYSGYTRLRVYKLRLFTGEYVVTIPPSSCKKICRLPYDVRPRNVAGSTYYLSEAYRIKRIKKKRYKKEAQNNSRHWRLDIKRDERREQERDARYRDYAGNGDQKHPTYRSGGRYVRWLDAFRSTTASLEEVLAFEINATLQRACEHTGRDHSWVPGDVGIILDPSCITRRFDNDVWSEKRGDGTLFACGREVRGGYGEHTEAWTTPTIQIVGVALARPLSEFSEETRSTLLKFIKKYSWRVEYFRKF